ncbi:MAG: hypothetical protein M0Z27_08000 [Thermaerobacter sp.]|jgi:hypothetical protein|nr:hypothetical protein [Thermaerobacter sp.]
MARNGRLSGDERGDVVEFVLVLIPLIYFVLGGIFVAIGLVGEIQAVAVEHVTLRAAAEEGYLGASAQADFQQALQQIRLPGGATLQPDTALSTGSYQPIGDPVTVAVIYSYNSGLSFLGPITATIQGTMPSQAVPTPPTVP